LRALGAREVIEADSSGRALLEVEKGAFDVLLTGEGLPDMSGADLAWCLKRGRNKRLRKISVVPTGEPAETGAELYLRIFQEIYEPNPEHAPLPAGAKAH
jgi:DNA-binding NarL/FixJ family response regulator